MNRIGPYRKRRSRRPIHRRRGVTPPGTGEPAITPVLVTDVVQLRSGILRWTFDHTIISADDFAGLQIGEAFDAPTSVIAIDGMSLDLAYETTAGITTWHVYAPAAAPVFNPPDTFIDNQDGSIDPLPASTPPPLIVSVTETVSGTLRWVFDHSVNQLTEIAGFQIGGDLDSPTAIAGTGDDYVDLTYSVSTDASTWHVDHLTAAGVWHATAGIAEDQDGTLS